MEKRATADIDTTEAVDGVHLGSLVAGDQMSLQHFTIEPGKVVPSHSHHHEQTGYLIQGTLRFVIGETDGDPITEASDTREIVISAGDSYVIPPNEAHGVYNDGEVPAEGIDVFAPPRTDPDWQD